VIERLHIFVEPLLFIACFLRENAAAALRARSEVYVNGETIPGI
jgi:hypothetical protein